jgi:hypothetical protein
VCLFRTIKKNKFLSTDRELVACNIFHKFDKCKTLKIATSSFPKNLLRIYLFLIAQNVYILVRLSLNLLHKRLVLIGSLLFSCDLLIGNYRKSVLLTITKPNVFCGNISSPCPVLRHDFNEQ